MGRKEVVEERDKDGGAKERKSRIAAEIMNENKSDLSLYLEKNSENLDINLVKKLALRKDPLFERTSRKFDVNCYASFFMNTLTFSESLQM